ncbi:PE/PPE C-terminal domain-containing protein, partial [Mycobacterium avium]|uniref:PE/PPE C-terminal domain-containing protein n=1 Tax=Mycobacterium avium TaxID=1764 RepID=UPI001F354B32
GLVDVPVLHGFRLPLQLGDDVGEANTVGRLSVPPTWASATPAIRLASGLAPATAAAAAPAAGIPAGLLGQMALGSVTGGALGAVAPQV